MARPIKETPILYGEDARRFEREIQERNPETPEERAIRLKCYEIGLEMLERGKHIKMKTRRSNA